MLFSTKMTSFLLSQLFFLIKIVIKIFNIPCDSVLAHVRKWKKGEVIKKKKKVWNLGKFDQIRQRHVYICKSMCTVFIHTFTMRWWSGIAPCLICMLKNSILTLSVQPKTVHFSYSKFYILYYNIKQALHFYGVSNVKISMDAFSRSPSLSRFVFLYLELCSFHFGMWVSVCGCVCVYVLGRAIKMKIILFTTWMRCKLKTWKILC